jgi:hypothetical protein
MRYDGATFIATFGTSLDVQVHRESAGAPLAMRLLRSLVDIRDHRVLFVNDCLPVVLAMRKDSQSLRLQADSEYMAAAGLEAGASLLYLHVPGTRMIEEGVDGASRTGAQRIIEPTCAVSSRDPISELMLRHGWQITIDLFAVNCNKIALRFASWTDEPYSEKANFEDVGRCSDAWSKKNGRESRLSCAT